MSAAAEEDENLAVLQHLQVLQEQKACSVLNLAAMPCCQKLALVPCCWLHFQNDLEGMNAFC